VGSSTGFPAAGSYNSRFGEDLEDGTPILVKQIHTQYGVPMEVSYSKRTARPGATSSRYNEKYLRVIPTSASRSSES